MGGGCPELTALVFANLAHRWARQPLFDTIFEPGALLRVPMEAAIASYPDAAISTAAHQSADTVVAAPRVGPIPPIEFPNLFAGCAPNRTVGQFGERYCAFRRRFVG